MQDIPNLVLRLCERSESAAELAAELHCLGLIDIHRLKYYLIYMDYAKRRADGWGIMDAMEHTAEEFNISLTQVRRVRVTIERVIEKKHIEHVGVK